MPSGDLGTLRRDDPQVKKKSSVALPNATKEDIAKGKTPGRPAVKTPGGRAITPGLKAPVKTAAEVAAEAAAATAKAEAEAAKATARADALATLTLMFQEWGLESLAGVVAGYLQQDYTVNQILVEIRKSEPYKKRFAGNEARVKAGYAALDPSEYLAVENAYKRILQSAGLPKGFYDDPGDFTNWIGLNVSAAEIQERVDVGVDAVNNSDPNYLAALRQVGLGEGDLLASVLDQDRALPILRRQIGTAKLGSAAMQYGLSWTPNRAESLYDQMAGADGSVDASAARLGYSQVAAALPAADRLSGIYGDSVNQSVLEDEFLGQSALASQRRGRLARQEETAFSGSGGAGKTALGTRSRGEY